MNVVWEFGLQFHQRYLPLGKANFASGGLSRRGHAMTCHLLLEETMYTRTYIYIMSGEHLLLNLWHFVRQAVLPPPRHTHCLTPTSPTTVLSLQP